MTRKEKFEADMQEYFPSIGLKEGKLNPYKNNYANIAWFFYEQGRDDERRELHNFKQSDYVPTGDGWKVELPPRDYFQKLGGEFAQVIEDNFQELVLK